MTHRLRCALLALVLFAVLAATPLGALTARADPSRDGAVAREQIELVRFARGLPRRSVRATAASRRGPASTARASRASSTHTSGSRCRTSSGAPVRARPAASRVRLSGPATSSSSTISATSGSTSAAACSSTRRTPARGSRSTRSSGWYRARTTARAASSRNGTRTMALPGRTPRSAPRHGPSRSPQPGRPPSRRGAAARSSPRRCRRARGSSEPALPLLVAALHDELGRGLLVLLAEDADARDAAEAAAGSSATTRRPLPVARRRLRLRPRAAAAPRRRACTRARRARAWRTRLRVRGRDRRRAPAARGAPRAARVAPRRRAGHRRPRRASSPRPATSGSSGSRSAASSRCAAGWSTSSRRRAASRSASSSSATRSSRSGRSRRSRSARCGSSTRRRSIPPRSGAASSSRSTSARTRATSAARHVAPDDLVPPFDRAPDLVWRRTRSPAVWAEEGYAAVDSRGRDRAPAAAAGPAVLASTRSARRSRRAASRRPSTSSAACCARGSTSSSRSRTAARRSASSSSCVAAMRRPARAGRGAGRARRSRSRRHAAASSGATSASRCCRTRRSSASGPSRATAAPGRALQSFSDLRTGDYVVHEDHGIAQLLSFETKEVAGVTRDYLLLAFRGDDRVYVPHEQIGKVSRYVGADAKEPDALEARRQGVGQPEEPRARASARDGRRPDAALRRAPDAAGLRLRRRPRMARAAREEFPYRETEDQRTAIEAVKEDLEAPRPMDRLVCGDVGFGKTEVALRAAFAVAVNGKQVLMLVPTTVLAQQHWNTFRERYRDFPVRVEMASRFRKPAEVKKVLAEFADGKVEVLIGTHRVLGRDVDPEGARARDRRRGAALRRRAEGAAAPAAARGRRALAVGDADPAHAAHVARRPPRHLGDRDAAGRTPADPHLRRRVRRRADQERARARGRAPGPGVLPAQPRRDDRRRRRTLRQLCPELRFIVGARPDGRARARGQDADVPRRATQTCSSRRRSSSPVSTFRRRTR